MLQELPAVEASTAEAWLLLARIHTDDGDLGAARDALSHALDSARPEGYRRPFFDARPWVKALLRAALELTAEHQWLGPPLVDRVSPAAQRAHLDQDPPPGLVEPLTERERAVLARMAQAKSTDDIVAELYLSVNTVKTQHR